MGRTHDVVSVRNTPVRQHHVDASHCWAEPVKIDEAGYLLLVSEAVTGVHRAGVLTYARGDEG
jgi:hypothetical protein